MISISNTKHWLIEQASKRKDDICTFNDRSQFSYSQMFKKSIIARQSLIDLGVIKNDHAGILCANNIDFYIIVNALWFIGAVPIPLNIRNTEKEIEAQISFADVKYLLIHKELSQKFSSINIERTYYFPFKQGSSIPINYEPFELNKPAIILFTSGTSGSHKAVMLSFFNLIESVKATDSFAHLLPSDIWLASLPFYHIGGFMILCRSLIVGSSVAFLNSLQFEDIIWAIQQFQPSHISLVSTTLQRLLKENIQPYKNLKHIFLGGGPTTKELCAEAISKGFPITKVYGSTETCSMITALKKDDFFNKPDSAGEPLDNTTIAIMNECYEQVSISTVGEIAIKSNSVMIGYYKNESENRSKLCNGFYYTGDFGWIDKDGYLFVESRREDLIVTGGENVSPREIEDAIREHDIVNDVYVFPINDSEWGQIVCAAISLKKDRTVSQDELTKFLKTRIASYKIPKKIFFVAKIPRNELGKVLKDKLLELLG